MVDRKVVGPLPLNPCNQWYKVQLVVDYWLHFPGTGVRESTPMSLLTTRVIGSEQVCRPHQTEGTGQYTGGQYCYLERTQHAGGSL